MSMTYEQASKLVSMLKDASPVFTGQLQRSVQKVFIGPDKIIVIIGNSTVMGLSKTIQRNGHITHVKRTVPSNVYAAKTNNAKTLKVFAKGKRKDPRKPEFVEITNPNYHWVNEAIEKWAKEQAFNLVWNTEEDEE